MILLRRRERIWNQANLDWNVNNLPRDVPHKPEPACYHC